VETLAVEARKTITPFHWWIEFPEVFFDERPDPLQGGAVNGAALMESVIGNPPFAAKNGIVADNGPQYIPWLLACHSRTNGNSDLAAFFFRRSAQLIGRHGSIGLVATNTISQGDTRRAGLAPLIEDGCSLRWVLRDMEWPGDAAVTVSVVVITNGRATSDVHDLNERRVIAINSRLRVGRERKDARSLAIMGPCFFMGSKIYGKGFYLNAIEAGELRAIGDNREAIFETIGGENVNTDPRQLSADYVIAFGQRTLDEVSRRWPTLLGIVESRVKPDRDTANDRTADGAHRKKYWWQYAQPRPELYAAIAPLERCLVAAVVTKHLCFSFQPTDRIFSHKLYVFPFDHLTVFAILQSRVHMPWAWLLCSTMRDAGINYSASDCFETFPFPQPDPRTVIPELEFAGQSLYDARANYMVDTDQGLTKTYNALKDPACTEPRILELRRLHEAMDRAVLDAYGWTDIAVPPYCAQTGSDEQALQAFEDEVIDRLYVLNAERAREEERLGLSGKKGRRADNDASDETPEAKQPSVKPARGKKTKAPKAAKDQGKLFE
jgi:hypothetical protein